MIHASRSWVRGVAFALAVCILPLPALAAEESDPIETTGPLEPGQFVWNPKSAADGPLTVIVSIPLQHAYVFRGDSPIGVSTVSTGMPGYDTPTGMFTILEKKVHHRSNRYDDAPMPFMQRLTWDGIALHAGRIPGYAASHGCVRLPKAFARALFRETRLGATVVITDEAPASATDALALAGTAPTMASEIPESQAAPTLVADSAP